MKITDKIKSYSFWVSLASAVILILKVLGNRFGFTVDETMISDLFTALCSILVLLGIIVVPNNSNITTRTKQTTFDQTEPKTDQHLNQNVNENININIDEKTDPEMQTIPTPDLVNQIDEQQTNIIDTVHQLEEPVDSNINTSPADEIHSDIEISNTEIADAFTDNESTSESCDVVNVNDFDSVNENVQDNQETNLNCETKESPLSNISKLKQLFDAERANFSQNINDYIFELQEEIRKAREKM